MNALPEAVTGEENWPPLSEVKTVCHSEFQSSRCKSQGVLGKCEGNYYIKWMYQKQNMSQQRS